MNIGLFSETYYPEINGVANSVYLLKTELEKRGHNVYVFTTKTPGAPEHEHNVFRVPSVPFISERRVGLFYQPKLASVIKRLGLDIIHTNTEFSLGIFGRIMARELKIPSVHTYHTIYEDYTHFVTHLKVLDHRMKAFARSYSRHCCNYAEKVIVPTQKTKDLLLKYNVHKDIAVVPTGIELGKFDKSKYPSEEIDKLKKQYGISEEEKVLLYLGRVSQEKNLEEVIQAMPEYMGSRDKLKFVVVGNGPALEKIKDMAEHLKLMDKFVFTGAQPWDIVGLYYQLGDVFVSASQSETQGLTYIEAMAAGLPVVAKEDKCLDDILEQGQNGYTFTDKDGLFYGLDQILFGDTITNFSENAINKVKKYSTEEFAYQIEKVYEEVIAKGRICVKKTSWIDKKI